MNFQSEILNNNSNVLSDILTLGLIVGNYLWKLNVVFKYRRWSNKMTKIDKI